jgi:hypothetical protein
VGAYAEIVRKFGRRNLGQIRTWQSHLNGISVYSLAGADLYTSTRIPDVERRPVDMPAPRDEGPLSRCRLPMLILLGRGQWWTAWRQVTRQDRRDL